MKKSLIRKGAIVVVVLLLFIGYIQYRDYKNTHFAVDKKAFHVKGSMDTVIKDINKNFSGIEGAFKYHIAVDVNKEVPLVGERRELKIEKAWLSPGFVYLFYSVNLLKNDQSLKDIPTLQVGKITFHRDNGPDFSSALGENQFQIMNPSPDKKGKELQETFDHRVYQNLLTLLNLDMANMNVDFNDQKSSKDFQKKYLEHVTSVTLSDVHMVLGKTKTAVSDIQFPASFNFDKYLVKTIPINKDIQLGDMKIKMKDYKKYYDHGELDYTSEDNTVDNIVSMKADVNVNGAPKDINWDSFGDMDNTLFIREGKQYFPETNAKSITITPKEIGYVDKTPFKIHLTKQEMEDLDKNHNAEKKVGDIKNGSIFLSLGNDQSDNGFSLKFKYDTSKFPHVGQMNFMSDGELRTFSDEDRQMFIQDNQIIEIDLNDGEGHPLNTFHFSGMTSDKPGVDVYKFNGDKIDWFKFTGLDITLHAFVYMDKITSDPITIQLEK